MAKNQKKRATAKKVSIDVQALALENSIRHAKEQAREAYQVVEAMRQPLEGADAVLTLIMNACEGEDGAFLPKERPETIWQALNLVRRQVSGAREACTIKGDALTRYAALMDRNLAKVTS